MTTNHEDILRKIIDERGYLVLGTEAHYRPGQVLGPANTWRHPLETANTFYVIEETNADDLAEQDQIVAEILGKPQLALSVRNFPRFYRISTD